jgi:CDP-diacylglycerol--glycerol-3-phosphate 3-phosphatidyltransferase
LFSLTMPRALPRQITHPIVAVLARLGVTPNMLTIGQLLGGIGAAYVISTGELLWGGIALLAASSLDAFDGTLARTTGRVTKFGGVLDSTIDRLFEGAVLGGLLYYYLDNGDMLESMLVYTTIVGSICVSYVRARAEVEGISMYDGIFSRVTRILVLSAGLVFGGLIVVLWVLAVMTLVTVAHRLLIAYQRLKDSSSGTLPGPQP